MNFILNRNYTHASKLGHAIEFEKDVPTHVPPALYAEVQAIGALPEEELPEPASKLPGEPEGEKRNEDMLAAIAALVERNTRTDFGANGIPTLQALTSVLGWKPSATEARQMWARFQADKS